MAESTAQSSVSEGQLTPFRMPSLGADMEVGTILEWFVAPGSTVHKGDIVALVETEKSDLDIEVFHDALVAELVVPVGVEVPVGTVLAMMAPVGAEVATPSTPAPASTPVAATTVTARQAPASAAVPLAASPSQPVATAATAVSGDAAPTQAVPAHEGHMVSPVLRHLAETLHVDTAHLQGHGVGGRITRDDIEHAAARQRVTPRARRIAHERGVDLAAFPGGAVITGEQVLAHLSSSQSTAGSPPATAPRVRRGPDPEAMRRAIARQMTQSWQQIPHFRVSTRIEVNQTMGALETRNIERPASERILLAAVLARAVARAAAKVPAVNGHWIDGSFVPGDGVHLGIVVSLRGGGLLAPVIPDADRMDLVAIMGALRDLVTRARTGHLRASELGAATITVTDLGEGGVDEVTPIIHPPQVAIVGFGSVHPEPWALDGEVVVRSVVHATLAGDHRAIDGRVASLFLTTLANYLQEPLEQ